MAKFAKIDQFWRFLVIFGNAPILAQNSAQNLDLKMVVDVEISNRSFISKALRVGLVELYKLGGYTRGLLSLIPQKKAVLHHVTKWHLINLVSPNIC